MITALRVPGCMLAVPLSCAMLLMVPLAALAAGSSTTLDQIVVTATRTAQTQDATLAPVTVITRAQIDLLQPASLQDLLNSTPGMAISNSGGPGKITSLFLRGTQATQILVLVDGIRVGSVSAGSTAIQDIPVDQIQRIEIVRGPFSSLYGSEAIGGVIQIFLRHESGTSTSNANVGFGSHSHWKAAAGFSANARKGWLSAQVSHERTDGINACRVGAAEAFAGCFADEPDVDGYHDSALSLNGAWQWNDRWSVDGLAFRSQGHNDYDGTFSNANDYSAQVLGGQLHYQPSERVKVSLRAGSSTDFATDFLDGTYVDHFDTRRGLGSLQADIAAAGGLLTLGFDWQREALASNMLYVESARVDRGLFTQWQRTFGAQSVQANLRRDDDSQFGGKTTGSLLWGWDFAHDLRITASYGTAFRAPTFNDLYYPYFGNPDLEPESSRNLELGLRGTPGWGNWSVNVYRNDISDMIAWDAAVNLPGNIDRVRITGIEGVLDGTLAGWDLRATATLLRARDTAHDGLYEGNELPRRPGRSARFDADRAFGRFSVGTSWYLASSRYDDIANLHRLGGYALVDLRAGWKIDRNWSAQLAFDNVLDKDYETAWFYNQPGRTVMLTLRWNR